VDAAVSSAGVVCGQAQDQGSDGAHGAWPPWAFGPGCGSVASAEQVAVPGAGWCPVIPAVGAGAASATVAGAAARPATPGQLGRTALSLHRVAVTAL
jgi:hypothetical protein